MRCPARADVSLPVDQEFGMFWCGLIVLIRIHRSNNRICRGNSPVEARDYRSIDFVRSRRRPFGTCRNCNDAQAGLLKFHLGI